jgi:hypothetical protein
VEIEEEEEEEEEEDIPGGPKTGGEGPIPGILGGNPIPGGPIPGGPIPGGPIPGGPGGFGIEGGVGTAIGRGAL